MKKILIILFFLLPSLSFGVEKTDSVLVIKSESKLFLLKNGTVIRNYQASFGANPKGHKQHRGDERTPEGRYILDNKNGYSTCYKSIHISYPNKQEKERAKYLGINPGGDIMIHGQKNGFGWLYFISRYFNWTDGCIAVSNKDMDEIWEAVDVGTPIEIQP